MWARSFIVSSSTSYSHFGGIMAWYILAPGIRVSSECVRFVFFFAVSVVCFGIKLFSTSPIRTNPTQPAAKRWRKKIKLLTRFDIVRVTRPVCVRMLTKSLLSSPPSTLTLFASSSLMPRFVHEVTWAESVLSYLWHTTTDSTDIIRRILLHPLYRVPSKS